MYDRRIRLWTKLDEAGHNALFLLYLSSISRSVFVLSLYISILLLSHSSSLYLTIGLFCFSWRYPCFSLFFCLSIYLYVYSFIYLNTYLFICLLIYLSKYLSVFKSLHISLGISLSSIKKLKYKVFPKLQN